MDLLINSNYYRHSLRSSIKSYRYYDNELRKIRKGLYIFIVAA